MSVVAADAYTAYQSSSHAFSTIILGAKNGKKASIDTSPFRGRLLKRHARRDRDVGFKMEGIGEGFTSYGETV